MDEKWRRSEPAQFSRKEVRFTRLLQYAASFRCLVDWHDCEKFEPKTEETSVFVDKEGR